MSMPFYVSPEQLMKDRADFARKGIARGRSVAVVQYADGVLFVSENPSQALHKVSEIYDRIAFAAVGRYNEFENLRIAGVRLADLRGYSYDRSDVTGRGLANAYAQTLGTIFSSGGEKPYEVEIFVAEVGDAPGDDQIFRLTYEGRVVDEQGFAVMGGEAEAVEEDLRAAYTEGASLQDALRAAVTALGRSDSGHRVIPVDDLEVAVIDRTRTQPRKFARVRPERVAELKVGPSLAEGVDYGPLVTSAAVERVTGCIQQGVDEGATLLADGRGFTVEGHEEGFYLGPTLFDHVTTDMAIYREEIFGPVLVIARAADYEEALAMASDHEFGNGVAIFTRDGDAARDFVARVNVGMVGVNVPIPVPIAYFTFGGWKRSGFGDLNQHGPDAFRFYTKTKTVTSRWPAHGIREGASFVIPTLH